MADYADLMRLEKKAKQQPQNIPSSASEKGNHTATLPASPHVRKWTSGQTRKELSRQVRKWTNPQSHPGKAREIYNETSPKYGKENKGIRFRKRCRSL